MAKVSVLAKLVAHEGKGDELVSAFEGMFGQVEQEPGTELYVLNRSATEPDVFWFYELYADQESLNAHGTSDAMKQAMKSFGGLIASNELVFGTPLRAKGLDV